MNYPRNNWYVGAAASEVTQERPLARRICGEDLVFFRTAAGSLGVLEDRCPHRMAPLSLGRPTGEYLECGYHGARFDAQGSCVGIPCQPDAKKEHLLLYKARAYRVVERFGFVFVWHGDAVLADESLLPNWGPYTAAGWVGVHGYHDVGGNYQLLLDNLNDLSHLSFVHRNTLGKADGHAWTEVPVAVETSERKVYTSRVMRDVLPTAFAKALLGLDEETVDRFQTSEFELPTFIAVVLGTEPTAAALERMSEPTHAILNAVTPIDAGSSHYFWSVNLRAASPDEKLPQMLHSFTRTAFDEDKVMIEAQQRRIQSAPPGQRLLSFRTDRAVGAARHLIETAMKRQES